jgi:hypothetical protein
MKYSTRGRSCAQQPSLVEADSGRVMQRKNVQIGSNRRQAIPLIHLLRLLVERRRQPKQCCSKSRFARNSRQHWQGRGLRVLVNEPARNSQVEPGAIPGTIRCLGHARVDSSGRGFERQSRLALRSLNAVLNRGGVRISLLSDSEIDVPQNEKSGENPDQRGNFTKFADRDFDHGIGD